MPFGQARRLKLIEPQLCEGRKICELFLAILASLRFMGSILLMCAYCMKPTIKDRFQLFRVSWVFCDSFQRYCLADFFEQLPPGFHELAEGPLGYSIGDEFLRRHPIRFIRLYEFGQRGKTFDDAGRNFLFDPLFSGKLPLAPTPSHESGAALSGVNAFDSGEPCELR